MTQTLTIPFGGADWATIYPALAVALSALAAPPADLLLPRPVRRAAALALGILGLAAGGALAAQGWGHPLRRVQRRLRQRRLRDRL